IECPCTLSTYVASLLLMRYSSSDIVSVSSSSAGEGKPADTVPRTGRGAPRGPGRSRCTAAWAPGGGSTRRSTCVQTAWLERSPVIAMSSLSLGIRFVLPVKARIIYNYGWNYVQNSVCEHLFTCQAHLFSTHLSFAEVLPIRCTKSPKAEFL